MIFAIVANVLVFALKFNKEIPFGASSLSSVWLEIPPINNSAGADEAQIADDLVRSGLIESYNTHFELANSQYLNIKLDSSENIRASLESVPEMVVIRLGASASAASSAITLGGFLPLTEYHKYEDDYTNHETFTTDENGSYAYIQDISEAHLVFIQPRPSTILISDDATGGDCELKNVGVWDEAAKTCTLTGDLAETVQIQNNGITLDGGGHSIIGKIPITGNGVYFNGKTGITVKNLTIRNFSIGIFGNTAAGGSFINNIIESDYHGIVIDNFSSNITISGNAISSNTNGININNDSNNNTITDNIVRSHTGTGIFIFGFNNTVTGNTIENNGYGLFLYKIGSPPKNNKVYNNNFINNTTYQAFNKPEGGNIFNLAVPIGGNYWSNWTSPDSNNDRFVDSPYVFIGGMDNLPWTAKNAWLDSIAPATTVNLSGIAGENGWYTSAVQVTLQAEDNIGGVGVEKIEYGWDGLTWKTYSLPFAISADGVKKLYYRATDKAKNIEPVQSKEIKIDTIAPWADAIFSGNMGTNSWYISDVSTVITAGDIGNGSGLDKIEYSFDNSIWNTYSSVFTLSEEGEKTVFYRAKDKAGNVGAAKNQAIKIDKTLPVISGKPDQPPNQNNWYNRNVTIDFTCVDNISGPVNPVINIVIVSEGAGQQASGQCIDKAGNNSSLVVDGINIDKTNPEVTVMRSPEANAKSWNNTAVIATFVATDGLSNIDGSSTGIVNFNSEGAGQEANRVFKDRAGNQTTGSISGINIDLTPPVISGSVSPLANANGWNNTDVAVHFSANDDLSGIASITPDVTIASEGEGQEAVGYAEDIAGNSSSFKVSNINIDKTSPVVTGSPTSPANSNNWYNADVKVRFSASDSLSGIASITPVTTIFQEGAGQAVSGIATDKAGNSASVEVNGINLDKTAPTTEILVSGIDNKCSSGAVNISFAAADNLSGIAKTVYNLDGKGWTVYAGEFNVLSAGKHNLAFQSYDNADNMESEQVRSFTISDSLLEAAIKFDPDKKDIKVYNISDGSEADYIVVPPKKEKDKNGNENDEQKDNEQGWVLRKYQIKDCSDDSLSIVLKYKNEGRELKAAIVSLQYNNDTVINARENKMAFEYSLEKNGGLKELTQNISAKNKFDIGAKYNASKDQTAISIKLAGKREKKEIKIGMTILEMVISNGTLKYKY